MVSLSVLRTSLFPLVKLAQHDGLSMKFYNGSDVFVITIQPTYEKFHWQPTAVKRRRNRPGRAPVPIDSQNCPTCGYTVLAGICINKKCETNTRPKPES